MAGQDDRAVYPYVGRSLRRREDLKFLTGRGRYVDDIVLRGMLYLAIFMRTLASLA